MTYPINKSHLTFLVRGLAMSKAKDLEQEWGMPLEDILTSVIETTDTQAQAAALLGVNQSTISYWLATRGLKVIRKIEYIYTPTGKQV